MSADNKAFSIGQIVYVLSNKNQAIVPVMIVEEQTVQTLEGRKVSWKFAVGTGKNQKVVDSKQLDGELYSSLEEIKTLLTEKLSKFIESVVNQAAKQEEVWYGQQLRRAKESGLAIEPTNKIDPGSLLDGVVSSPTTTQSFLPQVAKELDKEAQKRKMREMLTPDDEEPGSPIVDGDIDSFIENGGTMRVKAPGN